MLSLCTTNSSFLQVANIFNPKQENAVYKNTYLVYMPLHFRKAIKKPYFIEQIRLLFFIIAYLNVWVIHHCFIALASNVGCSSGVI